MIHSVYVPQLNGNGCHPGGNCCDSCRGHHLAGDNSSTISCDDGGNCYEVTSRITYGEPVDSAGTTGSALPPLAVYGGAAIAPAGSAAGSDNKTLWYIGGALALVLLLEGGSRMK